MYVRGLPGSTIHVADDQIPNLVTLGLSALVIGKGYEFTR